MSRPTAMGSEEGRAGSIADRPLSSREAAFRVALGAATLAMMGLSWPLWFGGSGLFPRVPFLPALPEPSWMKTALGAVLAGSIALGMVRGRLLLVGLPALLLLVAGDQHRLQPWAYQYGLMALALGTLPGARALGLCRVVLVALYLHSGLSKLDATFAREVGAAFLVQLTSPMGMDPMSWPVPTRSAAAWAMPAAELLVGVGLASRRSRPYALAGAAAMHGTLIAILGPWGLDHSTIVVVWNLALIVEGLILFAGTGTGRPAAPPGPIPRRGWPAVVVVALACVLPALERRGWWDTWPSFALYASHAERVYVYLHADAVDGLPEAIRRHLRPPRLGDPWRQLDLTSWSRAERGTPPYPQARAAAGVAEALADGPASGGRVRVVAWGRADRWSGRRTRREAVGGEAIRQLADSFAINAHPAVVPGRGTVRARSGRDGRTTAPSAGRPGMTGAMRAGPGKEPALPGSSSPMMIGPRRAATALRPKRFDRSSPGSIPRWTCREPAGSYST